MNESAGQKIVVVGAGIVGISTAIWLMRAGRDVTVVDRHPVGTPATTSTGNAGVLAACSVVPVTSPGLAMKGPKLLLDPNFPLFMRWSYLPRLAPWLARYLSHANVDDTRRIAQGLTPLVFDSVEQHRSLTAGTDAAEWLALSDYGFAYRDRQAFEADAFTWTLRREAGFEPELVEGDAVRALEPSLGRQFDLVALMKDHGYVRDPASYLLALKDVAQAGGVDFLQGEVVDFEIRDGRLQKVVTDRAALPCDAAVLTAGVWSRPLAKKLGLKVPLETERGYHIQFEGSNITPRLPLMITTGKFVATPMANGLRCAGVVEFGGLDAPASSAPLALLKKQALATFPGLTAEKEVTWLGHRPAPTDSLPLIGEIGGTGVFAGFGHHHIGLTAGPKTGRILAGLITGDKKNIDLAPYRPDRFGGRAGAHH